MVSKHPGNSPPPKKKKFGMLASNLLSLKFVSVETKVCSWKRQMMAASILGITRNA